MNREDAQAEPRKLLAAAIQESGGLVSTEGDAPLEGCALVGWVVVAEWAGADGHRFLSRLGGNAAGDPATNWQMQGYLHNALFDDWDQED